MDENIYEVEFKLPEDVEKRLRAVGKNLAVAMYDTMDILYPGYEFDSADEVIQTLFSYIVPVVMEEVADTLTEIMEEGS